MPISSKITPPAILKAGSVIPNSLKIRVPAPAKAESTRKQVQAARRAMRRRWSTSAPAVMIKNVGIAAIGSTRKKIEVRDTRKNWSRAAIEPGILSRSMSRLPLAVIASEKIRGFLGTPGAGCVVGKIAPWQGLPVVQYRLHHAPTGFDHVRALEQRSIPDHAVIKKAFVPRARLAAE